MGEILLGIYEALDESRKSCQSERNTTLKYKDSETDVKTCCMIQPNSQPMNTRLPNSSSTVIASVVRYMYR